MLYKLLITYRDGTTQELPEVEEFVAGFHYLFIRTPDKTLSFDRTNIENVKRKSIGSWLPVMLKKPVKTRDSH